MVIDCVDAQQSMSLFWGQQLRASFQFETVLGTGVCPTPTPVSYAESEVIFTNPQVFSISLLPRNNVFPTNTPFPTPYHLVCSSVGNIKTLPHKLGTLT